MNKNPRQLSFLAQVTDGLNENNLALDIRSDAVFSSVPPKGTKYNEIQFNGKKAYEWEWVSLYTDANGKTKGSITKVNCHPGYGDPEGIDDSVGLACLNLAYRQDLDGVLDKELFEIKITIRDILEYLGLHQTKAEYKQKIIESICRCCHTSASGDIWFENIEDGNPKHKEGGRKKIHEVTWEPVDRETFIPPTGRVYDKLLAKKPPSAPMFYEIKNGVLSVSIDRKNYYYAKKHKMFINLSIFKALNNPQDQKFYRFFNEAVRVDAIRVQKEKEEGYDAIISQEFSYDLDLIVQKLGDLKPFDDSIEDYKKWLRDTKRKLVKGPFDRLYKAGVLKKFESKIGFYKGDNGKVRVKLIKGPFYDEYINYSDFNNYLRIYRELITVCGINDSKALSLIKFAQSDIKKRSKFKGSYFEVINLAILLKVEVPHFFKVGVYEYLDGCRKKFKNNDAMDVTSLIDTINYLKDNVPKSERTQYQLSWNKSDIKPMSMESKILKICKEWNIQEGRILSWLKKGVHQEYICRLHRVYQNLSTKEKSPGFLCHLIENEDMRVWREAVQGSEHEAVQMKKDVQHNKTESILPDSITIIPEESASDISYKTLVEFMKVKAKTMGVEERSFFNMLENPEIGFDKCRDLFGV